MSAVLQRPAIKFLPPQLADQIAAGEVIERPASVLKELIENALDAHCSRVDIDLSAGGMEHIRVTDNGDGIPCDELLLAVCRHATSKLSSLNDLLVLQTLGFRGEALASICSVSQWQLISSTGNAAHACKLANDMTQPISDHHPQGTTLQIDKLFHNTPARRKFLRAERTEFRHSDDVIRRMALARFDVGFFVKHNGRQVHRLPAVADDIARSRRVSQLCGESFLGESRLLDYHHDGMRVWGWVGTPAYSRQQADLQYFYINGRTVRDRMINHAIRLAYQHHLPTGRQAAYVLHLEIEPDRFDVNVHPTKQEVRFRETRMVHDFLSRSLRQALEGNSLPAHSRAASHINDAPGSYHYEVIPDAMRQSTIHESTDSGVPHTRQDLLFDRFLFTELENKTVLVDLQQAYALWAGRYWYQQFCSAKVTAQPLLIPARMQLDDKLAAQLEQHAVLVAALGLDFSLLSTREAVLRFMPGCLAAYAHQGLIETLLPVLNKDMSEALLCDVLLRTPLDVKRIDRHRLLLTMASAANAYADSWREMTAADLRRYFL